MTRQARPDGCQCIVVAIVTDPAGNSVCWEVYGCGRLPTPAEARRSTSPPEHQVEVLHGGARRALAEIVVDGDQRGLRASVVGKDVEPHAVGVVEGLGI